MDAGKKTPQTQAGPAEGMVNAAILQHCLRICEAQGIPRALILEAAGLTERQISPPDGWVSMAVTEQLFLGRIRHWPDDLMGLRFAYAFEPPNIGLLGFMSLSSPTVRDLLRIFEQFGVLITNMFHITKEREPGRVKWIMEMHQAHEELRRHSTEWVMASLAGYVCRLFPDVLLEVHFSHAPVLLDGMRHPEYREAFAVPVHFEQPKPALVLDAAGMRRLSPLGDSLVYETLNTRARMAMQHIQPGRSLVERVVCELRLLMTERQVSREGLCSRLGISSRHLHRQLQQSGTSYQQLLDEIRLEQAQHSLRNPVEDLESLAADLGFSSGKSLSRWFLSQTGLTPAEYRRSEGPNRIGG